MTENRPDRLINLTFLREFCRDDRQKIANYIHMFLQSAPEQLEFIRANSDAADWNAVKAAAHSLKPQLLFIGADNTQPLIKKIESSASLENAPNEIPALVLHLEELMQQSFHELIETLVSLS